MSSLRSVFFYTLQLLIQWFVKKNIVLIRSHRACNWERIVNQWMNDKRSSHQDELRRSREGFKDYGGVITDGNGAFNVELNRSSPLVATKFLVILKGESRSPLIAFIQCLHTTFHFDPWIWIACNCRSNYGFLNQQFATMRDVGGYLIVEFKSGSLTIDSVTSLEAMVFLSLSFSHRIKFAQIDVIAIESLSCKHFSCTSHVGLVGLALIEQCHQNGSS